LEPRVTADFLAAARAWLLENPPERAADTAEASSVERAKAYMARLYEAGYSGIAWPVEYGGRGLPVALEREFNGLAREFDLPTSKFTLAFGMCGPTVLSVGTEEQKRTYIPPILRGEHIWCQLFSEPDAGSDVASLRTAAVPDGSGWRLTGQKVWTSAAHEADYGLVLARTDPSLPKHAGLTMFILDMRQPEVTVRPLRDMTGTAHFNEVFLDGAYVARDAVVGGVNNGWSVAQVMLAHERTSIGGGAAQLHNPSTFKALREVALEGGMLEDPGVRDQLIDLYLHERGVALVNAKLAEEAQSGRAVGARVAVGKVLNARLAMLRADVMAEIRSDIIAHSGTVEAARRVRAMLFAPALSLGGGTNEIMLNVISEQVLDLPREPRADKGRAFNEPNARVAEAVSS
jgi:alkylation response protein AidB-like acyl-CoA dehydrogenase